MTEEFDQQTSEDQKKGQNKCKQPCIVALGILLVIIFILCIIILILALTVFKIKDPQIKVISMAVDGIALMPPSHSFKYKFNITLDLKIQVENPNRASFRHEAGKSELTYEDSQVGEMNIDQGFIPAQDSTIIPCRLALTLDALSSNTVQLLNDVQAGKLVLESNTRIPGRVSFLGGLIKKHVVAKSECEMTIGFPNIKILREQCNSHQILRQNW